MSYVVFRECHDGQRYCMGPLPYDDAVRLSLVWGRDCPDSSVRVVEVLPVPPREQWAA